MSIGGLLAGFVISLGNVLAYQLLAGADVLSFLVMFVLFLPLLREHNRRDIERLPTSGYRLIIGDRPFLGLVISNIAFIFCIFMLTTALPVYTIEALLAPAWVVGIVLALNTILMAGWQTLTVRLLETHRRTRVLVVAGLISSGSCSLLALALIVPQLLLVPYLIIVVGGIALPWTTRRSRPRQQSSPLSDPTPPSQMLSKKLVASSARKIGAEAINKLATPAGTLTLPVLRAT